jgi:Raf kinase inhibitor-like YbhB/YbcL family protein
MAMTLTLNSPDFVHNGPMPARLTCDDRDLSPQLHWSGVPAGAQSLALIVDDPDAPDPAAPRMTWVHWVLYNMPPTATGLPEGVVAHALPPGTREGVNDWGRTGYGGPCPPIGRHRYFHKLYALDAVCCRIWANRPRRRWNRPWRDMCWRAPNWWVLTKNRVEHY